MIWNAPDPIYRPVVSRKEENRHLQLQLAEAQAQEPEPVEVPPADYDELKERRVELEAQLKDTEQTLDEVKKSCTKRRARQRGATRKKISMICRRSWQS